MKFRLVALALAALASPSFATTTASVSTSRLDFTLKDLNAGDGVTPGLTWDSWSMWVTTSYGQQTGYELEGGGLIPTYGDWVNTLAYPGLGDPVSGPMAGGLGHYDISVSDTGMPALAMQLSVSAGGEASATTSMTRYFWLTAGTEATFSTVVDRSVSGDAFTGGLVPGVQGYPYHSDSGSSALLATGNMSTHLDLDGGNLFRYNTAAYEYDLEGDQLKLTIRNTGTTDGYFRITFASSISVSELLDPAATVVPEPGTYALMALGLLGVGAAARRRKH